MATEFLTLRQVAGILQVHPRTLLRWRKAGVGPFCIRLEGGQLRFPADELDLYLTDRYREAIRGDGIS